MTKRTFNYTEFVAGWRDLCTDLRLNPADGNPRVFHWPEERQQPEGRPWWADVTIFSDPGAAHSSVEAEALASIAAQARRIAGVAEVDTLEQAMTREFRQIVREVMTEAIPLRELHRRRGMTVEEVLGVRMEIPLKKQVA